MCTLTFTGPGLIRSGERRRQPASGHGTDRNYGVWFNRDEMRSRGPEIPPSEARTPSGVRYLAPTDSDAGGTWIAVNEFGVTVALLNGYIQSRGNPETPVTSRGVLVRSLADVRSTAELWPRLTPAKLRAFRPAVLCILVPGQRPTVARWDGLDVVIDLFGDRQLPLTSSSHAQDEVQVFRRELYREQVTARARGGPARPEDLEAYHAFGGPDGPSAMTPLMAREDAATRSHCAIQVVPGEVRFSYIPGPPGGTVTGTTVTLRSTNVASGSGPPSRSAAIR